MFVMCKVPNCQNAADMQREKCLFINEITPRAAHAAQVVNNVCVFITAVPLIKLFTCGTREEPGTLTQGGALFSLVPLVWESNPKLQSGWCKSNHQPIGGYNNQGCCLLLQYLIQSCARGGRRIVEDMCYEIRRAEACVD